MSGDFITMVNRIAAELNRSNMVAAIKAAINDAILEGSSTRFYFNEYLGTTFQTIIGQEYYPDLGFHDIDIFWWLNGTSRWNLVVRDNNDMNDWALGTTPNGPPTDYSRFAMQFRLYPIPNIITTMNVEGYGKLTPWPLVNDADTNNWMIEGERYIRAVAKRILLTDTIRDVAEATLQDAIADSLRTELVDKTTQRISTGVVRATTF